VPSTSCKDASNVESCCVEKALKGDLSDPSCTPKQKGVNWFFWGGVVLLLIALCIIGFFVYKKYYGNNNFGDDNLNNFGDDNFSNNNNFGDDNFSNNNNFGDNLGDNFVADNFDQADLDILNMPVPAVSPSK
jgi:hypothetical protein